MAESAWYREIESSVCPGVAITVQPGAGHRVAVGKVPGRNERQGKRGAPTVTIGAAHLGKLAQRLA